MPAADTSGPGKASFTHVGAAGAGTCPGEAPIRFAGVQVAFQLPRGETYRAVDTTDLVIEPHQFVAIVGPTGCGKSTLLSAAAGLLRPREGTVEVFGKTLHGLNRDAGYLFQQDALMPWKTARENVALGLETAGITRHEARQRAQDWLARVGLRAFGDRHPQLLSGGQRKRVALAQVLIREPKILLMDEPFGPLDAQTRQVMGDLLLDLWSLDRKAVLFVTHDLEEAIALADRVIIMSAGPNARVIGDFAIDLDRPRAVSDIRLSQRFNELHGAIWGMLRSEVLKTYGMAGEGTP